MTNREKTRDLIRDLVELLVPYGAMTLGLQERANEAIAQLDADPRGPDHRKGFGVESMGWEQNGCRIMIRPREKGEFLQTFAQELSITLERLIEPKGREEFIAQYIADNEITRETFDHYRMALPCDCGQDGCEGWAAVLRTADRVMGHIGGDPEIEFLRMRARLRELENKQNALRGFAEAVSVDKAADPALRRRATEALEAGDTPTHRLLGITTMQGHLGHLLKVYTPIETPTTEKDPKK